MPVVADHAYGLRVAQVQIVNEPALLLLEALAGVEIRGGGIGLAGVGVELRLRDAQRVLRIGARDHVRDQGQPARIVERVAHLAIERIVVRAAVVAIAIDREMSDGHVVAERAGDPARIRPRTERVEAAIGNRALDLIGLPAVGGEDLDDAAGRVAVERRERTAQDLDPLCGIQIELRDLTLPVRTGGRNAVLVHAHAADAEGGIRADAANGDLLVLGVVVAVAGQQSGDDGNVVREIDAEGIVAELIARDAADRCWNVERSHADARRRDDYLGQRVVVCRGTRDDADAHEARAKRRDDNSADSHGKSTRSAAAKAAERESNWTDFQSKSRKS